MQRKYDKAETYLLKTGPVKRPAWYGLAKLYLLQGKFDKAEKWAAEDSSTRARPMTAQSKCSRRRKTSISATNSGK